MQKIIPTKWSRNEWLCFFVLLACPVGCNECEDVGGTVVCKDSECFNDYEEIDQKKCIGKKYRIMSDLL